MLAHEAAVAAVGVGDALMVVDRWRCGRVSRGVGGLCADDQNICVHHCKFARGLQPTLKSFHGH